MNNINSTYTHDKSPLEARQELVRATSDFVNTYFNEAKKIVMDERLIKILKHLATGVLLILIGYVIAALTGEALPLIFLSFLGICNIFCCWIDE